MNKFCYLQVGNLEDELCESRLESSRLKSELVSEKTVTEIKLSELQSRLNEYEEERLLGSGRTKIPGVKTKLELSWQKEREESQRLLQVNIKYVSKKNSESHSYVIHTGNINIGT